MCFFVLSVGVDSCERKNYESHILEGVLLSGDAKATGNKKMLAIIVEKAILNVNLTNFKQICWFYRF